MYTFNVRNERQLRKIAAMTGRSRESEVIQDALALYEHLLQKRLRGDKMFVGAEKRSSAELRVTTFEFAARGA